MNYFNYKHWSHNISFRYNKISQNALWENYSPFKHCLLDWFVNLVILFIWLDLSFLLFFFFLINHNLKLSLMDWLNLSLLFILSSIQLNYQTVNYFASTSFLAHQYSDVYLSLFCCWLYHLHLLYIGQPLYVVEK